MVRKFKSIIEIKLTYFPKSTKEEKLKSLKPGEHGKFWADEAYKIMKKNLKKSI